MNILMLSDRFPPELRSAAHLFHELAREFQRRGHHVAVMTRMPTHYVAGAGRQPLRPGWDEVDGVPTYRVRPLLGAGQHPLFRALEHFATGWSVGRAACRWPGADVVLVYSPPLPLANAGARYQGRLGAPMILNVQDLYPQTAVDLGLLRNRAAIALAEQLERRAYQRAVRIVVHSPGNRDYLIERKGVAGDKIHVIYNWVDTAGLHPDRPGHEFRGEHNLGDKFVVSYAGIMGYAQDLTAVLDCAAQTSEPDVVFLLVGEGVLEPRWKRMVAERALGNVQFLPMQPKARYADLLAASDVCLVPLDASLRTPVVPGKLQSIMASGRPAIALCDPYGDVPKLIAESGAGVTVPPGSPSVLSAAIRALRQDRALRTDMGRRGRAFAEARFSVVRSADAYEALFTEVRGRPLQGRIHA